ncbi:MAG: hypothetical protein KGH93_02305 [Patescibacteria group bacterium]|nr:hypothetical protein [Patescibacteria group bacterium]MDE1946009.1 hypothetical protein [Patescibacteria group bacterium]
MISLLIFFLVGVGWCINLIILSRKGLSFRNDWTMFIIGPFFFGGCGVLGGLFIVGLATMFLQGIFPKENLKVSEIPLVAFNDGQSFHGSFILGTGSVDRGGSYLYYAEQKDGGIVQGQKSVDSSAIYEQERKDAVLETWNEKIIYTGKWSYFLLDPKLKVYYKFLVPKGTVIRHFVAGLH